MWMFLEGQLLTGQDGDPFPAFRFMHFISAYLIFMCLSVGFYITWTKEHFTRPDDDVIKSARSDCAYSMHTDYELYDTTHPKYFAF